MARHVTRSPRISDSYLKLVMEFPLASIKNGAQLARAQAIVDALLKRQLDDGEDEYLDALSDLIWVYEDQQFPLPDAPNCAILAHLMEAKDVSQTQLANDTKIAKSTISEVLSGKRTLSLIQIKLLAAYFHVGPGVFMGAASL